MVVTLVVSGLGAIVAIIMIGVEVIFHTHHDVRYVVAITIQISVPNFLTTILLGI